MALAPMTPGRTSARTAGSYDPAVESTTRATKAPDSRASSCPTSTRSWFVGTALGGRIQVVRARDASPAGRAPGMLARGAPGPVEDPVITLLVNGASRTVDLPSDTPLLWALRDALALTGTKFGCGVGACGSCTVLLDGVAVRSCQVAVGEVKGRRITTIEGLSKDGGHPVQRAWIADEVPQCGYCQPAQVLAAAALLDRKPRPTDAEIDDAMDGILCRFGTYDRIRRAVHRAAKGGAR